jgi:hypothetical protein
MTTPLSPAAQAYKNAYTAFDKVKNTFCPLVDDNRIIDDHTLNAYKEARNAYTQALDTLNAEQS